MRVYSSLDFTTDSYSGALKLSLGFFYAIVVFPIAGVAVLQASLIRLSRRSSSLLEYR